MALTPLGHRILVKPDAPEAQTDSGLVLPGDRDHVPTSGIVIAVGDGSARDAQIRCATIERCIGIVADISELWDPEQPVIADIVSELRRYNNQVALFERPFSIGDRVVYPVECGLAISQDGQDYILLNEDDAVVIATEEEAAA